MNEYVAMLDNTALRIYPEQDMAYAPVGDPKTHGYFEEHIRMADTEMGRKLNAIRVSFVRRYTEGRVLDIGIGAGEFMQAHGNACGFDIDPNALVWLNRNGLFRDPYEDLLDDISAVTFWDSIEHIAEPERILRRLGSQYVFVSIPIIEDIHKVADWKHRKRNEHLFYFGHDGFIRFMKRYGLDCLESNEAETRAGRTDIRSFVFGGR